VRSDLRVVRSHLRPCKAILQSCKEIFKSCKAIFADAKPSHSPAKRPCGRAKRIATRTKGLAWRTKALEALECAQDSRLRRMGFYVPREFNSRGVVQCKVRPDLSAGAKRRREARGNDDRRVATPFPPERGAGWQGVDMKRRIVIGVLTPAGM